MRATALTIAAALLFAATSGAAILTGKAGILGANQTIAGASANEVFVTSRRTALHIQIFIASGSGCDIRVEHQATGDTPTIWSGVSIMGSTGGPSPTFLGEAAATSGGSFDLTFIVPFPAGKYRTNMVTAGTCNITTKYIFGPEL